MLLLKIKRYVFNRFSKSRLTYFYNLLTNNRLSGFLIGIIFGNNLSQLAIIYNTDKFGIHDYTPKYQSYFKTLKHKKINLLEIGIGGHTIATEGGNSLRMWKRYFPFANIFAIDIYNKKPIEENRIVTFQGDQSDTRFLASVCEEIGNLDIIIDDGSHINEHVIKTFKFLFPKLNENGIYVIEDTQTSYWKDRGGNSLNLNDSKTMMNFFKKLTDGINYKEYELNDYHPDYFDLNITSIHFYHNMIFIFKGNNES